jgi:adenylosuccinate lyase
MKQCNLDSHITDSRFFRQGYATDEARQIFCDLRRMQRWLDVEVGLVRCQAALGTIPAAAAKHLEDTARLENFDLDAISNDISETGHSLVPLLREWQRVAGDEAGEYIHYGATTQDIQDTAQSLELKEIGDIVLRDLAIIITTLAELAQEHKSLLMIGRTHGQAALPTTLGLKIATWLDESLRNFDRLRNCLKSLLVCQLSGGVGTMDSLSEQAPLLLENFAAELGLQAPLTSWHASRDRSAEFLSVLALITGGQGRIANEICQLAKNEIGELAEPFHNGQIGSSTMPHKKNPELCEQVVVLAKLCKSNAATGLDTLINEHERDYRAVRLEWVAITDSSLFCCAALAMMKKILPGLMVNKDRIKENLDKAAMMVSTEALMFMLGKKIGKQSAHELIYNTSLGCNDNISDLLEKLSIAPELEGKFSLYELQKVAIPEIPGQAAGIINRLVAGIDYGKLEEAQQALVGRCPLAGGLCK